MQSLKIADQFTSDTCHWAVNLVTLAMAAFCAWKQWESKSQEVHDRMFWFAFFCWVTAANFSRMLDKLEKP